MVPRFKFGEVRDDGYTYVGKRYGRDDRGDWRSPVAFEKYNLKGRTVRVWGVPAYQQQDSAFDIKEVDGAPF